MRADDGPLNIVPLVVILVGLVIALFIGMSIGEGDIRTIGLVFGVGAAIAVASGLRERVWVLLPIFWGLTGSIYLLPLPFSVRDLVVLLVTGITCALLALRIFRFRNTRTLLDLILLLNLAQIVIVFISHPMGLRTLSSETVGARPYFNIVIATFAYLILCNQVATPKMARAIPILVLIPEALSSVVKLAVRFKPSIGLKLGWFYSEFFPPAEAYESNGLVGRVSIGTGNSLLVLLCSYFRPLSLINPLRALRLFLLLIAILLILISGFRSALLAAAAVFLLASYFRGGWRDLLTTVAGLTVMTLALIVINSAVHPLPLTVQRTLSFLPGDWDLRARDDATGSTEWRLEMWREIWKSSRYIQNKTMGDGFGFNRTELQAMQREHTAGGQEVQEYFMIIGAFHNGPLSAIRFTGVVGLVLYCTFLIALAGYAWRLIRRAERTAYYSLALFFGLGVIWEPINYLLVFGAYDSGLPNTIFSLGMLKLIHNSLEKYPRQEERRPRTTSRPASLVRVPAGAR